MTRGENTVKLFDILTKNATAAKKYIDKAIAAYAPTKDGKGATGTWGIDISGNAATATKLATARTIALSGNATGSTTFDGSGNATINATVNESAHAATATQVVATAPVGGGLDVIHAIMASDDAMRIRVYGDANNGALEIATGDDGTEPIYARQYKNSAIDKFTTVARTAAILDTNGNTSFPGTVTAASFTGPLNGNATSATTATALKIVTYRPADANTQYGDGNMRHYLASASMTKNKPPTGDGHIINLAWDNNGGYDAQLYVNNTTGRLNMRGQTAGKWSNWLIGLDSGNFNDYAPTKTGSGASGTWGINITGNAATATTANALNGIINREPATNNHAIIPGANARDYCEFHEIGAVWNFIKTSNEGSTTVASIRSDGFHGNVVGNASTATNADKLDGYHASDIINRITAANTGGIVAASLSANGYVKFANGFILQWGFVSNTKSSTSYNITFPITFASTCYGVHSTFFKPTGDAQASGGDQHDTVAHITTKGCQLRADNQSIFWTAIGV